MSLVDRAWPVLRPLMGYHAQVYRLTRGLIGHRFPGGPPMLLLDHVGAKSGQERTTPLVYVEDLPNLVIVASKGGHPRHPSWYHNLLAHPRHHDPSRRAAPLHPRPRRGAGGAQAPVAEGRRGLLGL
jgi:deazaflavin-dependent oxidoreductase (nitroreductase family)